MKTLFLDRDGVLNKDAGYTHIFDEKLIYSDVGFISSLNIPQIFIITNQSGIGRGYYNDSEFHIFMEKMINFFDNEYGLNITDFFYCPHDPTHETCQCRKPSPGMLLDAKKNYKLDLSESIFVGDKVTDIEAGLAAGCKSNVLLLRSEENLFLGNSRYSTNITSSNTAEISSLYELSRWFSSKL